MKSLKRSISATTRPRRTGEKDGRDYIFLTDTAFPSKKKRNEFLEWAVVFDHYYGTPKKSVMDTVKKGNDVLLTIDVQGARKIQKKLKNAVYVFLLPPSLKELEKRLRKRKTDSDRVIKKRLGEAKREIQQAQYYDYIVINDRIDNAVKTIQQIINSEKHTYARNKEVVRGVYFS